MKRFALLAALPFLVATADPATESEHVVGEGETLDGIANRAKVPAAVIAAANGLSEPYRLMKGQRLHIPRQRVHVVRPGETGFAIAVRYGVPFEHVAMAAPDDRPFNNFRGWQAYRHQMEQARLLVMSEVAPA